MKFVSTLFILALSTIHGAGADSLDPNDPETSVSEEITVTATAIPEQIDRVPAAVTVFTREEIDRRGARDIAEVLREVPGISVAKFGSAGKAASVFTRGGNSAHTLVLWNGIEINNPYFSGYDWGQFSTSGLERIEVVRGPFSALYGSDAVSGVVQILTEPRASGTRAELELGENGLRNGRVGGSIVSGDWVVDGAIEQREDDGFFANDFLDQTAATAGVRWKGSPLVSVGFFGRVNDYEIGIPFNESFGEGLVPTLERRQAGREIQFAIPFEGAIGPTGWNFTISRAEHEIILTDPEDPFGLEFQETDSVADRARLQIQRPTAIGTIVAGAEVERASVDDVSSYGVNLEDETRTNRAFFVEDRITRNTGGSTLELSAGVRHDDFDSFGSRWSPRVGAAWRGGVHRVRAAWGSSFRAPSIGELYYPLFGNPDLEPEVSRSWEAGYDWFLAVGMLSATLFHSDYEDLIVYDNPTFSFGNVGEASSEGVELSGEIVVSRRWSGRASWTWLDTEDRTTGEPLLRRPESSGSLAVDYRGDVVDGTIVVIHSGARDDIEAVSPYARTVNPSHTTIDARLGWKLNLLEPYLRVENLLDEEYGDVVGFPAPGRRLVLGVRYIR